MFNHDILWLKEPLPIPRQQRSQVCILKYLFNTFYIKPTCCLLFWERIKVSSTALDIMPNHVTPSSCNVTATLIVGYDTKGLRILKITRQSAVVQRYGTIVWCDKKTFCTCSVILETRFFFNTFYNVGQLSVTESWFIIYTKFHTTPDGRISILMSVRFRYHFFFK